MTFLKKVLFCAMVALFFMGNVSAQQDQEVLGITILYRSPTCETYCRLQFTVNKRKKAIIKTPGVGVVDRTLQRKTTELSSDEWSGLLNTFSMEEIKALPKTHGCPGCNDKPAGTLFVATRDTTYQKDFEALDPPSQIRKLKAFITKEYEIEKGQ